MGMKQIEQFSDFFFSVQRLLRSNVEEATLRHSGHTQNPLSSAFHIILILIGAKVFIVWVVNRW